jgi:uncharacterized protein (DUF983 family)
VTDDAGEAADTETSAQAIAAIANETRVAILEALSAADEPQSFSALRHAVGVTDSGGFNYHLDKLADRFIRKTDAGYELTYAGRWVLGSIRSGVYTDTVEVEPVDAGTCPRCGGQLRATYREGTLEVSCADCAETVSRFGVPPTIVEGFDTEELPGALSRWVLTLVQRVQRGFCPDCSGRTRPSLDREDDTLDGFLGVRYTCDRCGLSLESVVGATVLDHPAVVTFHADHGIDLRDTLIWEVPWFFEQTATVVSEDPLRVQVDPEVDGDRLSLRLDESFEVVSVDHQSED